MRLALDVESVLATGCLWLGLVLLVVTLLFVRDRRRLRAMLAAGVVLVAIALVMAVGMLGFGPDVLSP